MPEGFSGLTSQEKDVYRAFDGAYRDWLFRTVRQYERRYTKSEAVEMLAYSLQERVRDESNSVIDAIPRHAMGHLGFAALDERFWPPMLDIDGYRAVAKVIVDDKWEEPPDRCSSSGNRKTATRNAKKPARRRC